jgi:signal transduction histidine kinase/ActR/RegA family two-component response regulator
MNRLNKIWQKIKQNGCHVDLTINETKTIIYTNTLLIISLLAYLIFISSICFFKILALKTFFASSTVILSCIVFVFFLMKNRYYLYAKILLLTTINFSIFFYELNIGEWAGVHFYYFAFFFAAINIFSWKRERVWLIFHMLLPMLLVLATEFIKLPHKEIIESENLLSKAIYFFNHVITFLIIALNAYVIIKDNMKAQESLKQSQLNLKSLIDNTRGYIWSIDNNYKLIAFNNSFAAIIKQHYNEECYKGFDVNLILNYPNSPLELMKIYKKVLNGTALTSEYTSNNNDFEIQASPLFDTEGIQTGATFHSRIITTRKKNEQAIQQAKINLETLIDSIGNSTWSLTKDYKIIAASSLYKEDMLRIFGVDIVEGFDVSQLFSLPNYPPEWQEQYNTVFNGDSIYLDYMFEGKYLELNAEPIRDINNEIMGAVFFSRDITTRKNIEQELTLAKIKAEESTTAKAQFLSNMSHELRTPLNGIIGLTNILLNEPYLPNQTNHLEVLKHSSDHMLVLINDILDFNKIEAGKVVLEKKEFNLAEIIDKMDSFFSWEASSKNIIYEVNANEELNRNVIGDVTRLRQVLTNLISNAIKFTETGSVIFSVDIIEKIADKQCRIRFSITDTGIGIADNKVEQIFESFGQADASTIRKYGGSGLGLTISKKLISLMNGQLQVESKLKEGSRFWFDVLFDCSENKQTTILPKAITTILPFTDTSILVVEDNPVNMLVVTKMLSRWNVNVSKANNGLEAVDMVFKNKYSLILMDLQMPVMDGTTATLRIRELNKTTPIIALTATTNENLTSTLLQKGFNDVVQKPFVPEDLYNKINAALGNMITT